MSSFGTLFKAGPKKLCCNICQSAMPRHGQVSTFGESHGVGVGCIVDGIPANLELTLRQS